MKNITYQCNLCRSDIRSLTGSDCGIGIYFIHGNGLEFRDMNQCENHLCRACINGIKKALGIEVPKK